MAYSPQRTAVKVILSMWSLVSIEQQSPRRPCDSNIFTSVCQEFCPRGGAIPAYIAGGIPVCLAADLQGGGVLSQHAFQVVSQHALKQVYVGCLLLGGACSQGGACSRGVYSGEVCSGGGGAWWRPPRTATGMHSCLFHILDGKVLLFCKSDIQFPMLPNQSP